MAVKVNILHQDIVDLSNGEKKANSCFKILLDYLKESEGEGKMTTYKSEDNNGHSRNSSNSSSTATTFTTAHARYMMLMLKLMPSTRK